MRTLVLLCTLGLTFLLLGLPGVEGGSCAAGKDDFVAAGTCVDCVAGKFKASTGIANCMPCPSGTYSSAGATGCIPCARDTGSSSGAAVCCANNQYLPAGTSTCRACPDNSWSSGGAKCTANTGFYDLGGELDGVLPVQ